MRDNYEFARAELQMAAAETFQLGVTGSTPSSRPAIMGLLPALKILGEEVEVPTFAELSAASNPPSPTACARSGPNSFIFFRIYSTSAT